MYIHRVAKYIMQVEEARGNVVHPRKPTSAMNNSVLCTGMLSPGVTETETASTFRSIILFPPREKVRQKYRKRKTHQHLN